jgi:GntR family transcriptional regulator/MocR family aminotransferase
MLVTLQGLGPLYQRIYRSVRESILTGRVPLGSRLPVSRALALELGVSRNVVLIAYDQLIAEGYAAGRVGSGTYVSAAIPDAMVKIPHAGRSPAGRSTPPPLRLSSYGRRVSRQLVRPHTPTLKTNLKYDFEYGLAPALDFPHTLWRRIAAGRVRAPSLDYAHPEGHASLRGAIAEYLRQSRAVVCDLDQILIVNGSQQALDLTARVLLDRGDCVVVEEPGYPGAREVFESVGARLLPVPVDEAGLCVDRLPRRNRRARLAYVTPSHQFPAGAILPLARRLALLAWAERTGAYVLEDDYDSEYRYDERPVESVQGLDGGRRVLYIGTFSKVLAPALRVGYMVVPKPLMPVFTRAKLLEDRHTAIWQQEVLADFIRDGHFERYLRRCRARNASRRGALLDALEEHLGSAAQVSGASAGVHVLVWLRGLSQPRLNTVIAAAARQGVGIYSASQYYVKPPHRCELMLGYGALSERQIREGIRILGSLIPAL